MVRRECCRTGCRCKSDLAEVTEAQEAFVCALVRAQRGSDDLFKLRRDPNGAPQKTWLCPDCLPPGAEARDLLGQRVAKQLEASDALVFGEVIAVAGWQHDGRHIDERTARLLQQTEDEWMYIIKWAHGDATLARRDVCRRRRSWHAPSTLTSLRT